MAVTITTTKKNVKGKPKHAKTVTAATKAAPKAAPKTATKADNKTKPANKVELAVQSRTTSELVDLGGDLQARLEVVTNSMTPMLKAITAELHERAMADLGPEDAHVYEGEAFVAKVGKEGNARSIVDPEHIREELGQELFNKLAKIGLGDIDKYLTPDQIGDAITSAKTGRRGIKFEKAVE